MESPLDLIEAAEDLEMAERQRKIAERIEELNKKIAQISTKFDATLPPDSGLIRLRFRRRTILTFYLDTKDEVILERASYWDKEAPRNLE